MVEMTHEWTSGKNRTLFILLLFVGLSLFLAGCSQVRILKPSTGSTFALGERIEFEGEITRSYETLWTDRSDELFWSSSINGQLGAGRKMTTNRLSAGSHRITASWPYYTRNDSISIQVNP